MENQTRQNGKCTNCGREITEHYITLIGRWVPDKCKCITEAEQKEREQAMQRGRERIIETLKIRAGIKARYREPSLATMVPLKDIEGKGNQDIVIKKAREVLSQGKGILLSGGVGCGKTFIAAALANDYIADYVTKCNEKVVENAGRRIDSEIALKSPVTFISAVELIRTATQSWHFGADYNQIENIIERCKAAKLLVIDELGGEYITDKTKSIIYEIIDHRYSEGLQTVITTNLIPKEITIKEGSRISDRLNDMCITVTITSGSLRKPAC